MRLILLGPPGSGKGTQADIIGRRYGIPAISTGDIIRAIVKGGTPMGERVKGFIDKGELVPDEIVIELVRQRLLSDDCKNGYILDGFPRTVAQAQALEAMGAAIDGVIDIELPDELIVNRISGRRSCPGCGASYHTDILPEENGCTCGRCGVALIQREDDRAQIVGNRLRVYKNMTAPLTDYYKAKGLVISIGGAGSIEDVSADIFKALEAEA